MITRMHILTGGRRVGKTHLQELTHMVAAEIVGIDQYKMHSREQHIAAIQTLLLDVVLATHPLSIAEGSVEAAFIRYQECVIAVHRRRIQELEAQLAACQLHAPEGVQG